MNPDPILQYYALIVTVVELFEAATLIVLNRNYQKHPNKKIIFEDNILRYPVNLKQNFTDQRRLYRLVAWTSAVIIGLSWYLQFASTLPDPPVSVFFAIKFAFGVIVFSAVSKIITGLVQLFQLHHSQDSTWISGKITYSKIYILKLSAFSSFLNAAAIGFFAFLTGNAYLIGGGFIFAIFALRDFFQFKRAQTKAGAEKSLPAD
ncbi:MAG: hypothetical protein COY81_03925 [Candidatus Pacebacteria bacterium CG_4_10_14_0_8_um_filter_43_12]|nr:MAG: hypothetical protein COY81_03925 [Candidatus Pacebacteria bacterium CG_4_10_14_0_8_um_filter_43_12]